MSTINTLLAPSRPARARGLLARLCCAALVGACGAAATAAEPPTIAAEDFVRPAKMGAIRFSPDARHFAALAEGKGRMRLVVVDAETQQGGSYGSDIDSDIAWFRWLTNDMLVVRTSKAGVAQDALRQSDFQWSYISVGGKSRMNVRDAAGAVRRLPGSQTDVMVQRGAFLDVIDSTDGSIKRRLTEDIPDSNIVRWALDANLVPRAAMAVQSDGTHTTWWRDSATSAWKKLIVYKPDPARGFDPVGFDADGNLIVISNMETGRGELRRFDAATGKPGEVLVAHPQADIDFSDVLFDADRMDPIGVRIEGDVPQTYWFDGQRQSIQRAIDKSLPAQRVNNLQFLANGKVLVTSRGPSDPGTYYMFDPSVRKLTEWSRDRPWIEPAQMGVSEVMRFKARDGLEIPAYLTLPRGRDPKDLPLVVWVHGGPQVRDEWAYDPTVQYFANRGYAVLQVNYRGSTGYGDEFTAAGYRQWGRTMQDDLTDGARALIAQGRVDAKRVCIGGGSYGGYAALMGVIKEPELFRCAIDYVGVTDLTWMVELPEADFNWRPDRNTDVWLKAHVGNPDDPVERKVMDANSPRLLASKIKAPVLMVYGTDDVRVPLRHGTAMRDALQSAGAKYEWKSFSGEGHGVFDTKNAADLLRMMESFLNRNIGPAAGS